MFVRRLFAAFLLASVMPFTISIAIPKSTYAGVFQSAIGRSNINADATRSIRNGEETAADLEDVFVSLGLADGRKAWSAGEAAKQQPEAFHYRIAFDGPAKIGSVMAARGVVRCLKHGAPFPGDPENEDHWRTVDFQPGQSGMRLAALPPGFSTRAVLVTDVLSRGRSTLGFLRLFAARLHNLTPEAQANAEAEYTVWPEMAPPHTYAAADVVRGTGQWRNAGTDKQGRNLRPPISDINPSFYVLSWRQKQEIAGLWLDDDFAQFDVYSFIGQDGVNPAIGTDREWKKVADLACTGGPGHWVTFKPLSTRGIKLLIRKTTEPQVARISAIHTIRDLGDAPVPEARREVADQAPFRIPYTLPADGKLTLAIDGPGGTRVRNILGLEERSKGENAEHWDLKDEDGQFVAPGTYAWKAITHPPLGLRYEMTAYPNVHPDNSPWLNGHSGPGGWMADHTPPMAVCTAGDRVWLGSPVAESGVSLIECDLEGKKLWGHHSFAAFTGVWFLATDAKSLFVAAQSTNAAGAWGIDPSSECIWAFDIASKELRDVARLMPTNVRKRGMQGMAAKDGKLYLSINADPSWLTNAARAADVDIVSCLPRYPTKRKPRVGNELVPDPRSDFLRLFRLIGTPPGHGHSALTQLESTKGPGNRQHIVLAFNTPVPLGTVVYPVPQDRRVQIKLSVLKADAKYPPDPNDNEQWTPFQADGKLPWDATAAPENTNTRALRISFAKGADDVFSQVEDERTAGGGLLGAEDESGDDQKALDAKAWSAQIEGMKLLRRRYANLMPSAKISVSSGKVAKDGSWDAERDKPIDEDDPGIYMMEWQQPQPVRGLAINEIDGKRTEIDVFTGPDGAAIDLRSADSWEKAASYEQPLRNYYQGGDDCNPAARYMDGYVDFGREVKTRAVRLRIVEQWSSKGHYPSGVRGDRGGETLDAKRCRIYGVAPLRYVGGEVPVDPMIFERIEVLDAVQKKIEHEAYIRKPAGIAFDKAGELFAISEKKVVRVDLAGGKHQAVVDDLKEPKTLAFDAAGQMFVYDAAADRKVIRVYGTDGKHVRDIGTPGGYKAGPWDPSRFNAVTAIDVDRQNQLWVVDWTYWPKRISRWSTDGTFRQDYFGPTAYGGGGVLDPWDKSRLFYGPLEFELDWDKGTARLKNLTWVGDSEAGEVPIRIGERTYLVTRTVGHTTGQGCGVVYIHETDHLRRVAAVGIANGFPPMRRPEIRKLTGGKGLTEFLFAWSDLNGDQNVQTDEVALWPRPKDTNGVTIFTRDLGIQAGSIRFQVKKYLDNGVPVYEKQEFPPVLAGRALIRLDNGNFYEMGAPEAAFTPDGKTVWACKTEGTGVHALYSAKPLHPSQVVAQFCWVGHETAHAGDLGEFVVINSNVGTWNIWTSDGLLAGRIFRDIRDPRAQAWSMQEHGRGLRLDDITSGQEHFNGYFCRTADNKYYVVAGHNHASVVEVLGIENFKRLSGEVTVTADDVRKAQAWHLDQQSRDVYARAAVIDCSRCAMPIKIDGSVEDWDEKPNASIGSEAQFRISFDDKYLYVCYETKQMGPLKNTGGQWDRLFKSGAAVDLQMCSEPAADPTRRAPARGDFRLLMTLMKSDVPVRGEPTSVIYRPVVPGTPEEQAWEVVSPVFRVTFDQVRKLDDVRMAHRTTDDGYVLEAAIPLKSIDLKIGPDMRTRLDWGVLVSGKDGNEVMRRVYWSNKATAIISDAPSEAMLHPDLWGNIRFHAGGAKGPSALNPGEGPEGDDGGGEKFVDEIEEDLK